jgi:Tfp pilus assembly protein PilN
VRTLNLASRPFRNERLPNLLSLAALGAALVVSAWHLSIARDVLPDRTSDLVQKLTDLEGESGRLRAEDASLRALRPEKVALAEWKRVKDLVDQRVFSWSALFAVLEEALPDGVRLRSLEPTVRDGDVSISMRANARTHEEMMQMLSALEDRAEFAGVDPTDRNTLDDGTIDFECKVKRYVARATPAPAAAPPATAEPATDAAGPPPAPSTQAMR